MDFKSIIVHKTKIFLQTFRELLVFSHTRLDSGENQDLRGILEEATKQLKQDPNINSLYSYYKKKGFSYEKVLNNIDIMKEFFLKFQELSQIMYETFITLTKDCRKEFYKEKVGKWFLKNSFEFKEFRKITTQLGQYDRFHIFACIIFAIEKNRKTKIVTTDAPLITKSNSLLEFYNRKKKILLEQIRKLETD